MVGPSPAAAEHGEEIQAAAYFDQRIGVGPLEPPPSSAAAGRMGSVPEVGRGDAVFPHYGYAPIGMLAEQRLEALIRGSQPLLLLLMLLLMLVTTNPWEPVTTSCWFRVDVRNGPLIIMAAHATHLPIPPSSCPPLILGCGHQPKGKLLVAAARS